jgi:hypothetical protein
MRADALHFGGDMLSIAGTPAVATEHHLPLTSEGCNQLAGHLQDEMRHSCELMDDRDMLIQCFCNPVLQVHTRSLLTIKMQVYDAFDVE